MTTEKLAERPIKSWVRWGWFEDNILSKFTTLVDTEGRIISYLRSVQPITDVDGTEASEYESVKIRNHPRLIQVNTYYQVNLVSQNLVNQTHQPLMDTNQI